MQSTVRATSFLLAGILYGCAAVPPPAPPCSAPAGVAATVDSLHSVFGIALGQPLAIPECPKYGSGPFIRYEFRKEEACWQRPVESAGCEPITDGYAGVEFPVHTLPLWTRTSRVTVRIVAGRVEGARIYTSGIKGQDAALQSLIDKYGKPSSSLNADVQNRMGAQYTSLNSSWKVGDLTVVLLGTTGRLDEGQVEISTDIGSAAFKSDAAKLTERVKPL